MSEAALREKLEIAEETIRQLREQLGMDSPDYFLFACRDRLRLSRQMGEILWMLVKRERVAMEVVLSSITTNADADDETVIVRTQVSNLRKRLRRHEIEIETLWGFGYRLSPENRAKILSLLGLEQP